MLFVSYHVTLTQENHIISIMFLIPEPNHQGLESPMGFNALFLVFMYISTLYGTVIDEEYIGTSLVNTEIIGPITGTI